MSAVTKTFSATVKIFKDHPKIFLPFLTLCLLQILALIILYFSPRLPLRTVFGPIIHTFFGQRSGSTFLHYPYNFLLLPKLFQISSLGLSLFFGALTSGAAIFMVQSVYNKKSEDFLGALWLSFKKYVYLFIIVALWITLLHYSSKVLIFCFAKFTVLIAKLGFYMILKLFLRLPFLSVTNFLLTVFVHSLLVYAIPILVLDKEKLWKSIFKSLVFFKRNMLSTLILVGLPMLIYLPFSLLLQKPVFLMNKFFPEIVAYIIFVGIAVNYLLIDPLITTCSALFYLSRRKENKQ